VINLQKEYLTTQDKFAAAPKLVQLYASYETYERIINLQLLIKVSRKEVLNIKSLFLILWKKT